MPIRGRGSLMGCCLPSASLLFPVVAGDLQPSFAKSSLNHVGPRMQSP